MELRGYHALPEPVEQDRFVEALKEGVEQAEGFSYSENVHLPAFSIAREGIVPRGGEAPYDTVVAEKPATIFDWNLRFMFSVPRGDEVDGGWVHYDDTHASFDDQYREALEDILGYVHEDLGVEEPEAVI